MNKFLKHKPCNSNFELSSKWILTKKPNPEVFLFFFFFFFLGGGGGGGGLGAGGSRVQLWTHRGLGSASVITVELQWLEHRWLVYQGFFELVLESLTNKIP